MFINWEWLRYLRIFFLFIFKGIMWLFGSIIFLISILYMMTAYDKVVDIKTNFYLSQIKSAELFKFLNANQKPILQFRKNPDFSEKNLVLSYYLNSEQIHQAEQYLNKFQAVPDSEAHRMQCIEQTKTTKWLFPRISRHYVVDPEFIYKDYDSFLVYGSANDLDKVERACFDGEFDVVHFRLKNIQNLLIQVALHKHEHILMVNYKTENQN